MAWNLSTLLRAQWLRGWKQPRRKTILRGQLALEVLEDRNPPVSILVGGVPGGPGGAASTAATGSGAPATSASNGGPASTSAPATAAAMGAANTGSSTNTSGPTFGNNRPATAADVDPFANPFADPLGATRRKPPASGGGSSGAPAGSGGGNGGGGTIAANPSAAGPTPVAASSSSSGNDLWQAANVPAVGSTASGSNASATVNPSASVSQGTAGGAPSQQYAWLGQSVAAIGQVFEPNVGQAPLGVAYVAQGFGSSVALSSQEMDLTVHTASAGIQSNAATVPPTALSLQLVGANATAQAVAGSLLESRSNYFGGDSSQWLTNVPNYSSVRFLNVYHGINVTYYANNAGHLEFDFTVAPGADPSQIRFQVQGADSVSLDSQGNLLLQTPAGDVTQSAPNCYQTTSAGQSNVAGNYVLNADGSIGFVAGAYDTTKPLVVDPSISYSTLLSDETTPQSIAVDDAGDTYVAGTTILSSGHDEAFVTKLSSDGSQRIYTSYIIVNGGSSGNVNGTSVAIDPSGNAYLGGYTDSSAFPTTSGAYKPAMQGASDDFVAKFNATGSALLYSTLLDGSTNANKYYNGTTVAVDQYGDAYATGTTEDTSFPTTTGAFQTTSGGAFIVELNSSGSGAVYSSYLGGTGGVVPSGVAVDNADAAYVVGTTTGSGGSFTTTTGAYQTSFTGSVDDAFVTKVNAGGASLGYSTLLLGGAQSVGTWGNAVAVDPILGNAYVTGRTDTSSYPTTTGAYQTTTSGSGDRAFVTDLNSGGTGLVFSTYLAGTTSSVGNGIARARDGSVWVTGNTSDSDFPTLNPTQSTNGGGQDGFLTHLKSDGTGLLFSTYAGGAGTDVSNGVAVDALGNAYITGVSGSSNFPNAGGSGAEGAFVQKYAATPPVPVFTSISDPTGSSGTITSGQNQELNGTATPGATVTVSRGDVGVLGSVTANATTGDWTYDYRGTTLPAGTYDFTATQTVSGVTSVPSPEFLLTIDLSSPTVVVTAPTSTTSLDSVIVVTASELIGLPNGTAVHIDVDLNDDGSYSDTGDTNYASGTLENGQAVITLPQLPSTGTYRVRARVTDPAGNQGTSASDTITVVSSGSATITAAGVVDSDPLQGDALDQLGNVAVGQPLYLSQSPDQTPTGNATLIYNSRSVSVEPVVQAQVQLSTDTSQKLPNITATLTWDGTTQTGQTYSTSGFSPGDVLTLAQQVSGDVTVTGRHDWSLSVSLGYSTPVTLTTSGTAFVVNEENSPFGAGWTLSSVDQLASIGADSVSGAPAGELLIYGTGGFRFFADGSSTATFNSPANDNGTLTFSGSNYTYTTPAGDSTTFNSSGYETQWESADTKEVLSYSYNGSNQLISVTGIDGALATFTYSKGLLDHITSVNNRLTTFSYTSNGSYSDLTQITNPDGGLHTFSYDSNQRVLGETFGNLQNEWAYDGSGALHTMTWGSPTSGKGDTIQDQTVYSPAATQGLTALTAATIQGTVRATVTNPVGDVTVLALDSEGRTVQQWAADGGRTQYGRNSAGLPTTMTDPLGRTTTYTYDSSLYRATQTNPDGTTTTNAYQTTFHALTAQTDANGHTTSYSYDSSGHQTSVTNALNQTTTYGYSSATGLLTSVTDPLNHTTTYAYDSDRRQTTKTDALGDVTSYSYDNSGSPLTTTDANGHTATTLYDVMGRLTVNIDPLGNRTTYTYNAAGLQLTSTDPMGHQTSILYDSFNRGLVIDSINAAGTDVQRDDLTDYDTAGRVTATRDSLGNWTDTNYDPVSRPQGVTTTANGTATTTVYDLAGQAIATLDQNGQVAQQAYNLRGWVTASTDALGKTTTTAYDNVGNTTLVIHPLGNRTTSVYDALNRDTAVTTVSGTTTTAYDNAGNTTLTIDALGRRTTTAYDALNRATTVTDSSGTTTTAYDAVGTTTTTVDTLGRTTTYLYDAAKRRTVTIDPLGHRTTTTYDAAGDQLTATDPLNQTTTSTYNALNQLATITGPLGNVTTNMQNADDRAVATIDPLGQAPQTYYNGQGQVAVSLTATGAATLYQYDNNGNLTAQTDPNGNITKFVYDDQNRQIETIDPLGNITTTIYDSNGNVQATVDPLSRRTTYAYDSNNRQTQVTDALGDITTTLYDANGNQTVTIDARGNRTTMAYDSENRLTQTTDALGDITTTLYDASGNQTVTIDPLSRRTTYAYDSNNRQTQVTGALGDITTTLYDANGNKTVTIDARGNRTTMAYDSENRLTQTTDALGDIATTLYDASGNQTATIDARGNRTTYAYDGNNRLTQTTDALGDLATQLYDANGNQTVTIDARGNRTTMAYDAENRLTQTTDALGDITTTLYDASGNQTATIDALSHRTTYAYDSNNRQTQVTGALGDITTTLYDANGNKTVTIDARGNRTTMAYDSENRLTQTTDALGDIATTLYDASGNQTATIDARGNRTTYAYDGNNRLTQTTDALGDLATQLYDANGNQTVTIDARGNRTTMAYDAENRLTQTTDAAGDITTQLYDNAGKVTTCIDALGNRTTTTYDADNRAGTVEAPSGGITTTAYDSDGNVTAVTDPLNHTTTTAYDADNRKTTVTDARSGVTTYAYDAAGNQTNVIDADGNKTTFLFDAINRETKQIDPLGNPTTYAYDANGNQTSTTDALGRVINTQYDALNRTTTQVWLSSVGTPLNTLAYSYDDNGNELTAGDKSGTYTMTYDALNRMTSQTDIWGLTLTNSYDANGNRTEVQDSLGGTTSSTYDAANRLTSRKFTDGTATLREDFTYTKMNEEQSATRYSDLGGGTKIGSATYTYDSSSRVTNIQQKDGSNNVLQNLTYTYDNADRATSLTFNGATNSYTYDADNELTNDGVYTYTYDANGNRTMAEYTTGTGNQMKNDGVYTYTYDANGDTIKKSKGSSAETWTYGYDNRNQMIWAQDRATDGGTILSVATYTYDVFGHLIQEDQTVGTTTTVTRHAWDGENSWTDLNGSNALQMRYIHGDQVNELLARESGAGTVNWYETDRLMSVSGLVDTTGTPLDTITYDGFVNVISETNPANGGNYKGTGVWIDSETGAQIHSWRMEVNGRWMTTDPTGLAAGDTNLYRFVGNNAINLTDSTGLRSDPSEDHATATLAIAEFNNALGDGTNVFMSGHLNLGAIQFDKMIKDGNPPKAVRTALLHHSVQCPPDILIREENRNPLRYVELALRDDLDDQKVAAAALKAHADVKAPDIEQYWQPGKVAGGVIPDVPTSDGKKQLNWTMGGPGLVDYWWTKRDGDENRDYIPTILPTVEVTPGQAIEPSFQTAAGPFRRYSPGGVPPPDTELPAGPDYAPGPHWEPIQAPPGWPGSGWWVPVPHGAPPPFWERVPRPNGGTKPLWVLIQPPSKFVVDANWRSAQQQQPSSGGGGFNFGNVVIGVTVFITAAAAVSGKGASSGGPALPASGLGNAAGIFFICPVPPSAWGIPGLDNDPNVPFSERDAV